MLKKFITFNKNSQKVNIFNLLTPTLTHLREIDYKTESK